MFGLEKHNKTKPNTQEVGLLKKPEDNPESSFQDKSSNVTPLQKIRNSKLTTPVFQALTLGAMAFGGIEIGEQINDDITKHQQEQKVEVSKAAKEAREYSIEGFDDGRLDSSPIVNDDLISEIALLMKNDQKVESLIECRSSLKSLINNPGCEISKSDSIEANRQMLKYNSEINNKKKELGEKDKIAAKEKMTSLISFVEKAKSELIEHIKSDEYLEKLAKEMNISKEAAKEHQKVRVNNIVKLKYEFKNSSEIAMDRNDIDCYAYYSAWKNSIYLPYNIDLKDEESKNKFCESAAHEILHGATMLSLGMSEKSKELFIKSFKTKDEEEDPRRISYFSEPRELIVRKQVLDKWMEDNGLKGYDEKFTEKHYNKLLELQKEYKLHPEKSILPYNVDQLLDHIKPEYFIDVINELAAIREKDKTYYLSEFDYNAPEDKA